MTDASHIEPDRITDLGLEQIIPAGTQVVSRAELRDAGGKITQNFDKLGADGHAVR